MIVKLMYKLVELILVAVRSGLIGVKAKLGGENEGKFAN
jgi:hypothetical protein